MDKHLVTTGFDFQGYHITKYLGITQGIIVRINTFGGGFRAGIQALKGGNNRFYAELCEKARSDAFDTMLQNAEKLGANAVISMRYDTNQLLPNITEVLAYGTAVVVEKQ